MKQAYTPYLFLSPFLLLFGIFGVFPILFSLYLMFHTWDPVQGIETMKYVGLENIKFALEDPWVWKSLSNTVWLAIVSGLPQQLVAIPLAYLINEKLKRSRNLVMGAYFLPYITSTVAIAMMFSTLFSTDYGLVNAILAMIAKVPGLDLLFSGGNIDWLGQPETVKPVIAIVVFWRYLGFNIILYLAALQSIPRDLYEAARMDGASESRLFWHIILPQLKPIMYFSVTLSVIGGLQLFEEPFILTGGKGGVEQSGMTTAMYMFRTAFEFNDFGLASAISWMLFLLIGVMTWATNRAFRAKGADL
ncbi:MAG: sugar ABC transporter permease [Pseudomonadota bacterium]